MKVARILRFGPPNVITNDDVPRPQPTAGQLLVRVKAAGVGNWDALIRARYIIDSRGIIRAADVNADYTIRPEPSETVRLLRTLAK
jgi:NADPH:quinone reductase-like Zn-dependent oxidoreductase